MVGDERDPMLNGKAASRTSPPSSRCTSRCRSTPAASACSPAITARKPATSACRSSASASCIRRATSTSACPTTAGRKSATSASTGPTRRSKRRSRPTASPCITAVPLGDRTVLAAVWRVRVGRVRLFLLDTDLAENAPWDRELSARLYGGDRETRIQQEIILGIGGVRALRALGIEPDGVAPERRPRRVRRAAAHPRDASSRAVVRRRARRGAAHRRCSRRTRRCRRATMRFRSIWSRSTSPASWGEIGQHRQRFLALGEYDNGSGSQFNMTALALRTAAHVNGVSALHGEVTRTMWRPMWPDTPRRSACRSQHHQRRARADVDGRPGVRAARSAFRPGLARSRTTSRRCGSASTTFRTPEIWAMRQALRADLFSFIRERLRPRWTDGARRPEPHRRRRARCSIPRR